MMTIDEMIAVLTHYKNGGKVQARNHYSTEWLDFEEGCVPSWYFASSDYRAKPEPLVLWAEYSESGKLIAAYEKAQEKRYGGTVKKFVEVTE